jgi:hypothetical protein
MELPVKVTAPECRRESLNGIPEHGPRHPVRVAAQERLCDRPIALAHLS